MKNIFFTIILAVISVIPAKSQDSTDSPINRRLGVVCFPLKEEIGLTYCFGKKGRMKIEDNFKIPFPKSSELFVYSKIDELKFMYAWKSAGAIKVYSGISVEYGTTSYNSGQKNYDIYGGIIPIGIEVFPINRLPGLSFILESNIKQPHTFGGRFGLCCYF